MSQTMISVTSSLSFAQDTIAALSYFYDAKELVFKVIKGPPGTAVKIAQKNSKTAVNGIRAPILGKESTGRWKTGQSVVTPAIVLVNAFPKKGGVVAGKIATPIISPVQQIQKTVDKIGVFKAMKDNVRIFNNGSPTFAANWDFLRSLDPSVEDMAEIFASLNSTAIKDSEVLSWIILMRDNKCPIPEFLVSKHEDARKRDEEAAEAKRKTLEEAARVEALSRFRQTSKDENPGTLTSVKLKSTTCSSVMMEIGDSSKLFSMVNLEDRKLNTIRYFVHSIIVTAIQAVGGDRPGIKAGLEGQPYITSKSYSAAMIKAVLEDPLVSYGASKVVGKGKNKQIVPEGPQNRDEAMNEFFIAWSEGLESQHSKLAVELLKFRSMNTPMRNNVIKMILAAILGKSDYIKCFGDFNSYTKALKINTLRLDEWQKDSVSHIRAGHHTLIIGPTSGGKTFVSMVGLNGMVELEEEFTIMYVAPTFHLALQTYANIVKTYPTRHVSLVTGVINNIRKNTQIWIGTPSHLCSFMEARGIVINKAIFDEIHTISIGYQEGVLGRVSAYSIAKLLRYVRVIHKETGVKSPGQFIGLSATVSDASAQALRKYVAEQMELDSKDGKEPFESIRTVIYRERSIPQKVFVVQPTEIVPMNTFKNVHNFPSPPEDPDFRAAHAVYKEVEIIPQNTFNLLKQMQDQKRTPALIFDYNDELCFKHYSELVDYLDFISSTMYSGWHLINQYATRNLHTINSVLRQLESDYNFSGGKTVGDNNSGRSDDNKKKGGKDLEARIGSAEVAKQTAIKDLVKYICSLLPSDPRRPIGIKITTKEISNAFNSVYGSIPESNTLYDPFTVDTLNELYTINSESGGIGPIYIPCSNQPSFLRFGGGNTSSEVFKAMINPASSSFSNNSPGFKIYTLRRTLCDAERIGIDDVRSVLQMLSRGIQYGLGLILESMPYCSQHVIIGMLKKKDIPLVFASKGMSLGINYPLRSVVIRSPKTRIFNICEIIQMSGRCGRRGLDTEAFVYFINVINAHHADHTFLDEIDFPPSDGLKNSGYLIPNPRELAITLDICRSTNARLLHAVIDDLKPEEEVIIRPRFDEREDESKTSFNDEETAEAEEDEDDTQKKVTTDKVTYTTRGKKLHNLGIEHAPIEININDLYGALSSFLHPIGKAMNIPVDDTTELVERISGIAMNSFKDSYRVDAYRNAQRINNMAAAIQEIHMRYHNTKNIAFLEYTANMFEICHRVSYRQIRFKTGSAKNSAETINTTQVTTTKEHVLYTGNLTPLKVKDKTFSLATTDSFTTTPAYSTTLSSTM